MSEKNRPQDDQSEVSEVAELRQQLAETNRRLESLLSQREFSGDKQVVVNLPDNREVMERKEKQAIAAFDANHVRSELQLFDGPSKFRVCIIDAENMKRHLGEKSEYRINEPWEWRFNPFNPWRVVGAADRDQAQRKYAAYFGIQGFMEGEERNKYIAYECDEQGQRLVPVGV